MAPWRLVNGWNFYQFLNIENHSHNIKIVYLYKKIMCCLGSKVFIVSTKNPPIGVGHWPQYAFYNIYKVTYTFSFWG